MNIIQAKQAIDYFEGTKFKDIRIQQHMRYSRLVRS